MFTGIVEELGEVVAVTAHDGGARLRVAVPGALVDGAHRGDSYAVGGVCLTLTDWSESADRAELSFDVIDESLDRSTLGALRAGDRVNLERPVRLMDRLGGHLVQGHVDATAAVLRREPSGVVRLELPSPLARYVVVKGSITLDGVSLTVSALGADFFEVSLIPETLERTTMGLRAVGDDVNVEVDVLAKYTERLLGARVGTGS